MDTDGQNWFMSSVICLFNKMKRGQIHIFRRG